MLKLVIFNLLLCLTVCGDCQVSWFPTGAKWHYQYSAFIENGFTSLEVLDEDTLIGNHMYKKLLSLTVTGTAPDFLDTFTEFLYVFEENQVVFGYDQWSGGTLLYDFNATVGDTLPMYFGGWSPSPFIVDSIGTIEINGHLLTFQDIRFPSLFDSTEYWKMRAVEGIGSLYSHLFHNRTVIQPFDFPFYWFHCYEDANLGLYNVINQVDCDFIEGTSSIDKVPKAKAFIFPNPSADFITLKTEGLPIEKILVIDILGTIRLLQSSTHQKLYKIDISELENGLYFTIGLNKNGEVLFKDKITKHSR
ncbi:MAG TPA: T9SS type A sorting domain-containing protein [Saprospiraceae bacterium]|nr:T9SS type A sorting domain-containing protein [Saprospiraceae bacterium]